MIAAYVLRASLTYVYAFTLVRSRTAATAGVAYGLSEAMIARQAHINFVHAFAWFPLIVLAVDRLASGADRRWVAVGAAAVACGVLSPVIHSRCSMRSRGRRPDYSLQGLPVAPGPHTVVFEIVSRTAQAGTVLSVIAFIVCAGLILAPERVENRPKNAAVHVDRIGQNP